jgi:hypothetical protein
MNIVVGNGGNGGEGDVGGGDGGVCGDYGGDGNAHNIFFSFKFVLSTLQIRNISTYCKSKHIYEPTSGVQSQANQANTRLKTADSRYSRQQTADSR